MSKLKCPLCESGKMEHKPIANNDFDTTTSDRIDEYTHAWICPDCPCVIFEYWEQKDIDNLKKVLN